MTGRGPGKVLCFGGYGIVSLAITNSRPSDGPSEGLVVSFTLVSPFTLGVIVIAFWFARNKLMMKNMIGMTGNDFVLD